MGNISKNFILFINLILVMFCLVHISMNGYYILHPDLPAIRVYKKNLQDIDFPLSFKLCATETRNTFARYNNVGYVDDFDFFLGRSMHNASLFGWTGHTENGSTIADVEDILQNVFFDWPNILDDIQVYHADEEWTTDIGTNITWPITPEFPSCQTIDISEYLSATSAAPLQIFFSFNRIENLGVSLEIEDRYRALRRPLKTSKLSYLGPYLTSHNLNRPKLDKVILSISQTLDSHLDEDKNCKNYPNKGFTSYRACDEDFVYKEHLTKYKIMPFWVTDNIKEVTTHRIFDNDGPSNEDLLDGTLASPCHAPCLSTKIIGGQVSSRSAATNTTTFDLTLAQEVTVTESFYPAFSPLNFVTVTGGALGLWLGVGVVQVLSYVASAASWLTVQRHGRNKLS